MLLGMVSSFVRVGVSRLFPLYSGGGLSRGVLYVGAVSDRSSRFLPHYIQEFILCKGTPHTVFECFVRESNPGVRLQEDTHVDTMLTSQYYLVDSVVRVRNFVSRMIHINHWFAT